MPYTIALSYTSIVQPYVYHRTTLPPLPDSTRYMPRYQYLADTFHIHYFPLSASFPTLTLPLSIGVTSNDSCMHESILYQSL